MPLVGEIGTSCSLWSRRTPVCILHVIHGIISILIECLHGDRTHLTFLSSISLAEITLLLIYLAIRGEVNCSHLWRPGLFSVGHELSSQYVLISSCHHLALRKLLLVWESICLPPSLNPVVFGFYTRTNVSHCCPCNATEKELSTLQTV